MSAYLHKSHDVSILIYDLECSAKYQKVVFDTEVDTVLEEICLEKRYEIGFLEIATDKNHVYFFV